MQDSEISWLLGRRECVGRTGGAERPLKQDLREAALAGGSDQTPLLVVLPWMVFARPHILSSLVQAAKAQEGASDWPSLFLSWGDRRRGVGRSKGRSKGRSWFLEPLKREETSISHQHYA